MLSREVSVYNRKGSLRSLARAWKSNGVVGGRRRGMLDGDDRFTDAHDVPVEGVVAALEAGARHSAGARWRPSAAGEGQAVALRAGFSRTADFAEKDGADGESAVPLANTRGRSRCFHGVE